MKAVTIWQPWATLIMLGLKPWEFRRWSAPQSAVGQRIVNHAGKRAVRPDEIAELINNPDRLKASTGLTDERSFCAAMDLLEGVFRRRIVLPLGAALGTVALGRPLKAIDLFAGAMDPDDIDPDMWAWPLRDPEPFDAPIPAAGAQGLWNWSPATPARPGDHLCHAEGCGAPVPPKRLMCLRHWRLVPKPLQQAVWASYRPGQEQDKRPSEDYLFAARAAIAAVAQRETARLL